MITLTQLTALSGLSSCPSDPALLTDIQMLPAATSASVDEKVLQFITDTGNPYLFRVGDVPVKVSFNAKGKRLTQAVADALLQS